MKPHQQHSVLPEQNKLLTIAFLHFSSVQDFDIEENDRMSFHYTFLRKRLEPISSTKSSPSCVLPRYILAAFFGLKSLIKGTWGLREKSKTQLRNLQSFAVSAAPVIYIISKRNNLIWHRGQPQPQFNFVLCITKENTIRKSFLCPLNAKIRAQHLYLFTCFKPTAYDIREITKDIKKEAFTLFFIHAGQQLRNFFRDGYNKYS